MQGCKLGDIRFNIYWSTNVAALVQQMLNMCHAMMNVEICLACEQAPGGPERSNGACRHSIDATVLEVANGTQKIVDLGNF